jgi:pimeloyl-ACP methyl ester carboxylesterase
MRAFVGYWSGEGIWDILPPARQAALLEVAHGMHDEAKAVTFDETSGAVFETVRAKTVVVHGTLSPPASRAMAERLTERIEGASRACIEGAPHMGPITHADAFHDHVATVLG